MKLVEQTLLLRRGLCDVSKPDLPAVGRGQDNVGALQGRELRERLGRRETGATPMQAVYSIPA